MLAVAAFFGVTAAGASAWVELESTRNAAGAERLMLAPATLIDEIAAARRPVVELPLADGRSIVLRLEQTHVLAPALAARFPQIRTYRAAADERAAEARLELTPAGLRARIVEAGDTTHIEPAAGRGRYRVYAGAPGQPAGDAPWQCRIAGAAVASTRSQSSLALPRRRLRLALATTSEFTVRNGNTVEGTLARLAGTVNSVNGVFGRLGVEFELVAANDRIIFSDAQND